MKPRQRLWQLWLAFYLVWTGGATLLLYDDVKERIQTFSRSGAVKAGQPIEACKTMSEMTATDEYDQKLMRLYYTVYEQRALGDVVAELKALNALELYFSSATETGRHPYLDHDVHAVLRACAKARARIDEASRQQNAAVRDLGFYAAIIVLPPLIVLLNVAALVWIVSRVRKVT